MGRLRERAASVEVSGAEDVVAFFGRIVPRLWASPEIERLVNECGPTDLYGAFLFYSAQRRSGSRPLREPQSPDRHERRELDLLAKHQPDAVAHGRELLQMLNLES